MSLPIKMEFRHFLRYVAPGLFATLLYYPYFDYVIPFWSQATSTDKPILIILIIFGAGMAIDGIASAYSRPVVNKLLSILEFFSRVKTKNKLTAAERKRYSKLPKHKTFQNATDKQQEAVLQSSSVIIMASGCSLIFSSYLILQLLILIDRITSQTLTNFVNTIINNPVAPYLIAILSFTFLAITFLRVAIIQYVNYQKYFNAIPKARRKKAAKST